MKRVLVVLVLVATLFGTVGSLSAQEEPFSPSSNSWTSPMDGWVLGWVPCDDTVCAELRRTTDGGQTWSLENAPDVQPSEFGDQTRVFFAERGRRTVGLITNGRDLYTSFDRGQSWQQEDLGVGQIGAIGANDRSVFLTGITETEGTVVTQVFTTPIKKRRWKAIEDLHTSTAGFAASTLTDVATNGRAVQTSASIFDGAVQVWTSQKGKKFTSASPCDTLSATRVGVAGATRQFVLCSFNPGRGFMDKELKTTTDGVSYDTVSMAPRLGITSDFAVADETTLAIGATGGDAGIVHVSFDEGTTWETTLFEPDTGPVFDLDFQDSSHGTLVTGYPNLGTSKVFRTTDGGHTWAELDV